MGQMLVGIFPRAKLKFPSILDRAVLSIDKDGYGLDQASRQVHLIKSPGIKLKLDTIVGLRTPQTLWVPSSFASFWINQLHFVVLFLILNSNTLLRMQPGVEIYITQIIIEMVSSPSYLYFFSIQVDPKGRRRHIIMKMLLLRSCLALFLCSCFISLFFNSLKKIKK